MQNDTVDLSALRINRNPAPQRTSSAQKYILWAILLILLGGGGYFFVSRLSFNAEEVDLATATMTSPSQANSILTASGYVVAQRKAAVSSKATGRLAALYVIEGDRVKSGAILGKIESSDVEAALAQAKAGIDVAKANVESAKAELDDAKINLERQKTLRTTSTNTVADFNAAETRYKRSFAGLSGAEASLKVAEANVRAAQVQVENTVIRAPFDGTVLNKNANVGEVMTSLGAAAGARGALVTLADMASLQVEADVSESNIEKIKREQPCEITLDAFPEKRYRGFVSKIIPTADRAKATVQTKIQFSDRDERVLPEMSAKVLFLKDGQAPDAQAASKITIPASAVVSRNGKKVVFVVKNEMATETEVQATTWQNGFAEITNGLSGGEKVVLRPSEKLSNGASVKLKK